MTRLLACRTSDTGRLRRGKRYAASHVHARPRLHPSGLVSFVGDVAIERFIGKKATTELGAHMLQATGAHILRWMPPRTAVTMDFRADRLKVSYDDAMVIQRASCG